MITHNQAMRLPGIDLQMLAGERVLVAVSGGADSTALALFVAEAALHPARATMLAGLVHVNHQLRGEESDADEAFCRALAARLDVAIHVTVAPVAVPPGRSPEAAARRARYAAFQTAAAALGATCIATAHTLDDQVETVLLRVLRGAGLRGVAGIRSRRGSVVRPLISCRRTAVRAWLTGRGETWREDRSNDDLSIPRNRIRHALLPTLENVVRDVAPAGLEAIGRFAALADDDERALEQWAAEAASRVVTQGERGAVGIERSALTELPVAVGRRVIRQVVASVAPGVDWSVAHVDAVLRLAARADGGGRLHLPRVLVERVAGRIELSPASAGRALAVGPFEYRLEVPGSVVVPEAGVELVAVPFGADTATDASDVLLEDPGPVFTVRNRRPGDSVRTGSGHHARLQDLMVNAKIPRLDRDRKPLVVASDGQILWVQGLSWGRPRREGAPTGVVVLKVRKLETT
jgi:tRNA(Ile)-lysidine synthase